MDDSNALMAAYCPCGTGQPYGTCCGRFHAPTGHAQVPNAEALMRSRYSAFVLGLSGYLLETWHPSTRPNELEIDAKLKWLGLQVKHHAEQDENHATVEFVARNKLGGRAQRLHEVSRFVREEGRWFYVDGDLR